MRILSTVLTLIVALCPALAFADLITAGEANPVAGTSLIEFEGAYRLVRLTDGSQLLFSLVRTPKEASIGAMYLSSKGPEYMASLRVVHWIQNEMAAETIGQIYSVAMSDDGQQMVVSGGWMGRDDRRGHNGIFILQREAQPNFDYWRPKSWFDVRGMTIGDVSFGPDNNIVALSHADGDGPTPLLTVFSPAGRKLGSFVPSVRHAGPAGASSTRLMRIVKTGASSFALYDAEAQSIRYLQIVSRDGNLDVRQTGTADIAFAGKNVLAFDTLPDGRVAVAHTNVDAARRGTTLVTIATAGGEVVEQWKSPRVWRYAYAANHQFHGFYEQRADGRPLTIAVAVK